MFFLHTVRLKRFIALGVFALFMFPLGVNAQATGAASFSFSPQSGTYGVGKTFTVTVNANSPDPFNSANATINFDKEMLSVSSISKTTSAFSLWAVEPSFSNSAGTASFEGGNTTPLTGKKTILVITFKPLKEGKTTVSVVAGSILAADGRGTDILGTKGEASFDISASEPVDTLPPPPPPVASTGPIPDAPEIASPSHPNESAYASAPKAKFTWELPSDVTAVRMSLDTKEKTIPTTSYDPAIVEKEFDQLTDGIMYFHLRYKNDSGLGPTAHKKIMVDRTPPELFKLEILTDASSSDVTLKFNATDTLSGIDHFEIALDGGTAIKVSPNDVKTGMYLLSSQSNGEHTVKVSAFDKAGNNTPVEGKFNVTGGVETNSAKNSADTGEPKPTDWKLIGIVALIAIIAFLVGYMLYERSAFRHEKYLTKREADELRDNMGNIFAALREEVGEQTGRLFQKPNPSAQDREVMENINEAVDLSEELLSKEVEDVRKLLM